MSFAPKKLDSQNKRNRVPLKLVDGVWVPVESTNTVHQEKEKEIKGEEDQKIETEKEKEPEIKVLRESQEIEKQIPQGNLGDDVEEIDFLKHVTFIKSKTIKKRKREKSPKKDKTNANPNGYRDVVMLKDSGEAIFYRQYDDGRMVRINEAGEELDSPNADGNKNSTVEEDPLFDFDDDSEKLVLESEYKGSYNRKTGKVEGEEEVTSELEKQRRALPIIGEELTIMEAINAHPVVIICGETGSGKTTQVPQFLYEGGYGSGDKKGIIGVTQPRRVAAIAMSQRVAEELDLPFTTSVSYQVRYDSNVSSETKIKFMTDGILLREIQSDFLLSKYSVIIIDEAHERNLNTDVLIGLLSRIVHIRNQLAQEDSQSLDTEAKTEKRYPLKLVIMSATLRVEDFTRNTTLFPIPPPVITVSSRQYPVVIHFNRQTPFDDYLREAYKKVVKIHTKLPPGGILVFLTGQQEIDYLCRKLKSAFPFKSNKKNNRSYKDKRESKDTEGNHNKEMEQEQTEAEEEEQKEGEGEEQEEQEGEGEEGDMGLDGQDIEDPEIALESSEQSDSKEPVIQEDPSIDEPQEKNKEPLYVLPLYSALSMKNQQKVFKDPPPGCRLVVLATNVAETSITIPNIRYVIDTGKAKEKKYDVNTGVSWFQIEWISKASADQRSGRAGRTGPGHCYRLYSSAVFNETFPQFSVPEINRIPIDSLILSLKSMGIDNLQHFPFPTPPSIPAVKEGIKRLTSLGALDPDKKNKIPSSSSNPGQSISYGKITELGRKLAAFPVAPRYGKMLLLGRQGNCLKYTIAIVSLLSVSLPLISIGTPKKTIDFTEDGDGDDEEGQELQEEEQDQKEEVRPSTVKLNPKFLHADSDLLGNLRIVGAYQYSPSDSFCAKYSLNPKALSETLLLYSQLTHIIDSQLNSKENKTTTTLNSSDKITPPTPSQELLLRQIICAGFPDQIARIVPSSSANTRERRTLGPEYQTVSGEIVYIHPSSSVAPLVKESETPPEYLAYCELTRPSTTQDPLTTLLHQDPFTSSSSSSVGKPLGEASPTPRVYMKGVTVICAPWLSNVSSPLASFSDPLTVPEPKYHPKTDTMTCFLQPSYGPQKWLLPLVEVPYPDGKPKYKQFAKFLLEGIIFPKLLSIQPDLITKPSALFQSWNMTKANSLLGELQDAKICCKSKLEAKWKEEPEFLLKSFQLWVHPNSYNKLKNLWPPL